MMLCVITGLIPVRSGPVRSGPVNRSAGSSSRAQLSNGCVELDIARATQEAGSEKKFRRQVLQEIHQGEFCR